jgi:hypothetical protein
MFVNNKIFLKYVYLRLESQNIILFCGTEQVEWVEGVERVEWESSSL